MTLSFISTEKERLLIIVTDERSHLKSSLSVIGEQIIKGVAAHSDISAELNTTQCIQSTPTISHNTVTETLLSVILKLFLSHVLISF